MAGAANPPASPQSSGAAGGAIPASAGFGLRAAHYREVLETRPAVGWLEVHSENFFCEGGPPHRYLERIRELYPLSLHGIGLSLGGIDPLDEDHLASLERLARRYRPGFVSDHLCWCSSGGVHLSDLLPLPYTEEALGHVAERVCRVQDRLGRRILVENLSTYLRFRHSTMAEWEFLAALAERTGCGILLDVNNVHVSACNHGFDPLADYVERLPRGPVAEIHLGGFAASRADGHEILIDDHGSRVARPVWSLYERALERFGPVPTLVEWDTRLPALSTLLEETARADDVLARHRALAA